MPVFLFTYHGYGTWLPDRDEGFVQRGKGVLQRDEILADVYRNNIKSGEVWFDGSNQKLLIDELLVACDHQGYRPHYVATDTTHVHALVSWKTERPWKTVRAKLSESLTRRLNREIERRTWFVKSPSWRHVKDEEHFDYLINVYLPGHRGWKWREGVGLFK